MQEQELRLTATDAAVAKLAEMGWDPQFGARPVKRVIQRKVQDLVADGILAGEITAGLEVALDLVDGDFRLDLARSVEA